MGLEFAMDAQHRAEIERLEAENQDVFLLFQETKGQKDLFLFILQTQLAFEVIFMIFS